MEHTEPRPQGIEKTGKYSKAERRDFNDQLGPGTAVALESLRKRAGIRLKVTKRNRSQKAE